MLKHGKKLFYNYALLSFHNKSLQKTLKKFYCCFMLEITGRRLCTTSNIVGLFLIIYWEYHIFKIRLFSYRKIIFCEIHRRTRHFVWNILLGLAVLLIEVTLFLDFWIYTDQFILKIHNSKNVLQRIMLSVWHCSNEYDRITFIFQTFEWYLSLFCT